MAKAGGILRSYAVRGAGPVIVEVGRNGACSDLVVLKGSVDGVAGVAGRVDAGIAGCSGSRRGGTVDVGSGKGSRKVSRDISD